MVGYLPIITTGLALWFAGILWRRYRTRGGTHLLWWCAGMLTYAAGTLTESLTSLLGWQEPVFRAWYISGALLGGAPLAQGTVYLLCSRRLADRLTLYGYHSRAITGDIDQRVRLKVIEAFKRGELPILVATDVASRGLHIEGVSHVVNYDVPQDPEDYIHRIGRTARAGASGKAITLADEGYVLALPAIEALVGHKIPVEWPEEELFLKTAPSSRPPAAQRRRPRRRNGRSAR